MKPKHKNWLLLGCFFALWAVPLAQRENCNDSLSLITCILVAEDPVSTAVVADSAAVKRSSLKKFLDYFNDANKKKKNKKFDFNVIGGPRYSSDTKLGLELVTVELYYTDRADTLLPLFTVSLYGDVSTIELYLLGIRGSHIFPEGKYRLNYNLYFYSSPSLHWGIGYRNVVDDENENSYKHFWTQVEVDFMFRLAKNFHLGSMTSFDYIDGRNLEKPELQQEMDARMANVSAGLFLVHNSRDFLTNTYKEYYLHIDQRSSPVLLGNDYAFSSTELATSYYRKVWKGETSAEQSRTLPTYSNPPWGLMATLGSSYPMRGYYDGRFRDKDVVDMQVELRQHTWKRNGAAV